MLDAGAAYAFYDTGANRLSLLGGLKYTLIQWTATGGCYDYPPDFGGSGCLGDNERAATYRQSLPAAYAGIAYQGRYDNWSIGLDGRLGMTIAPSATDDHWIGNLSIEDDLAAAPYLALNGKVAYALSEQTDVFASVAYDTFYEMKGPSTYHYSFGTARYDYDAAGAELSTLNIAMGLGIRL